MPTISAFTDHPTHPYVRVEINWADTPAVTHAAVYRVDVATGECTPLRPYVCYNGWELLLSCGHGIFWDTEAPFDRPFYYVTTSSEAPCLPAESILLDEFDRTSLVDWGTADRGGVWQYISATPGQFTTTTASGGLGRIEFDVVGDLAAALAGSVAGSVRVEALIRPEELATGGVFDLGVMVLADASSTNRYELLARFELAGTISARLVKISGGVTTTPVTGTATGQTYSGVTTVKLIGEVSGSSVKFKIFDAATPEPASWHVDFTDTEVLPPGMIGAIGRIQGGNTNVPDFFPSWARIEAFDLCLPCDPVTVDTNAAPITLANDGRFWLKDPVRPCNDRPVPLCPATAPMPPECGGDGGILFLGLGPEIYGANSHSLRPMNRSLPLSATRPRSGVTTALRLQTMTFTNRDDLLALLAPGSPLLFQGPSEYGVPDRYMDVQDVQIQQALPDLRFAVRTETLPYLAVERHAGPTQGICGARVADICALYPTLDDLVAAGFTWDDLVAGQASSESANPNRRTYDDVNAEFADYDAVNTGGRDYNELYEGA